MSQKPEPVNHRRRAVKRGAAVAVLVIGAAIGVAVPMQRSHAEKEARREHLASSLAEGLRQLEAVRQEFSGLETSKRDELSLHVATIAPRAAGEVAVMQDAALTAQRKIAQALEGTLGDLTEFSAKRANVNFDRVFQAHELVAGCQEEILSSQQRALGELSLLHPGHPAVAAQQAAREAQVSIGTKLGELIAARDLARGSRLRTASEREYDHHTYNKERAERRLAQIPRDLETMTGRASELAAMQKSVAHELAVATDETTRSRLEGEAVTVTRALADLSKRKGDAEKQLASAASTLAKHAPKVAELEAVLSREPTPPTPEDLKVIGLQRELVELQRQAINLQVAAAAALKDFPSLANSQCVNDAMAALGTAATADFRADAYHRAIALEQELRASFRKIQAMDLAMTRSLPLAEAMASMEPAPLPRAELSAQDDRASAEIDSVVAGAHALLDQARRLVIAKETAVQRGAMLGKLESFVAAVREDPARDLTGLLAGRDEGVTRLMPGGPGGPPPLDAKTVSLPAFSLLNQREFSPPPAWLFVDHWQVLGPFDNPQRANIDTSFPPESLVDLTATYPGKNGVPIRWETVDSPAPNVMPPFRGYNQARKIDGLDEQTAYRSNLRYTIYYAYAELHFEQDCDRWLAIGSDDHSKIWINGDPVWSSGKDAKAWRVDEGYRKVHFKAGANRVLYRVENGDDRTEFSLLVGMQP
ncbi:hypothetical protein [Luteolibacter soli]|uniref:PA14 domain-containing protein n=1 Tax=Luteolibacter soli TaxID=3135280 RepID=A0ABU9B108_9BACT